MAISWLQGKHAYRIETQASRHKASKEQKIGRVRDRKQAKIARECHLPAIPVEVAEPVVAHINSTSYSRKSNEHWATEKMHFTTTAKDPVC